MTAAGALARTALAHVAASPLVPDVDYVFNHVVNRMPLVGPRLRAYAMLGVDFDDRATANIALGVRVWSGRGLSIGRRSTVDQRCYLDARGGLRIEHDVSISREVTVLTATHDPDDPAYATRFGAVHVGSHAWIGARALILPGVRIGEGAVVAAGAIVTRDVDAYMIVAGNPAKPLRERPRPMSYELDWRPSWH